MHFVLTKELLGDMVKSQREHLGISQEKLVKEISVSNVNRSHLAHLEQALRIPPTQILTAICEKLNIPNKYWIPFTQEKSSKRLDFESLLSELVGIQVSLNNNDESIIDVVEKLITELFVNNFTSEQAHYSLLRILVFYDIPQMSKAFFDNYISADAFKSIQTFENKIKNYQKDAIRLFSSFEEAYISLSTSNNFEQILFPLAKRSEEKYRLRSEWKSVNYIIDEKLPYLGYIAAERVKQESKERKDLANFLLELSRKKKDDSFSLTDYSEKTRRKYDSLLRKFNSKIEHGLFSPLFSPSSEALERESKFIQPEGGTDIDEMAKTQKIAYENLANYLSADFMDVYVATSMRSDADFISVNNFVKNLFKHEDIRPLKLRYFNPTQSWIEDRIAKGLVEALMLRRADYCIYMAQKEDTFGKDSEASVSLGQGKTVIVYVPKLFLDNTKIDSEAFGKMDKADLLEEIKYYDSEFIKDVDENIDSEALMGKLLTASLESLSNEQFCILIQTHWADYDLYGEVEKRIIEPNRAQSVNWIEAVIKKRSTTDVSDEIKTDIINILVATTIRYEKRAKIFREVHPLALQVILSTGVLNGILVTRSVNSCAKILKSLIINQLELELEVDSNNYRLIEKNTKSTIRVISRHNLLANSFSAFYRKLLVHE